MNRLKKILLSALVSSPVLLLAQVPKYSNEFLSVGVGARALSMANASVVSSKDVTAGYWNPSSLLNINSNLQLGLMHAEYFAGIAKYDYGALAARIDSNSAGAISLIRFGVDNIPNTTQLIDANGNVDYDKISKFSATDFAALISYARRITQVKGLNVGGNAKIIRRRIGDFGGSWGFGIDASASYQYRQWQFSAVGRDITGTFNAWSYNIDDATKQVFATTGNDIPKNSIEVTVPKLILGGARKFSLWKDKISLLAEMNLINTFDGKRNVLVKSKVMSIDPVIGIEAGYMNFVFLRAGLGNIQKTTDVLGKPITTIQPNIGVGIKYKIFSLDYALTDIGDQSVALYSNIFSLKVDINKKAK
ncbi:MAG: PorV/PorQ family protein [Bacteroidia bacterium]